MMDSDTVPKHVEFYSKFKFENLGHLIGFIIRIPYLFIYIFSRHYMTYTYCCVYNTRLLMMDIDTVPKHVEFYSKFKFENLGHLVGFIMRIPYLFIYIF